MHDAEEILDGEPAALIFVEPVVRKYDIRLSALSWLVAITFIASLVWAIQLFREEDFVTGIGVALVSIILLATNAWYEFLKCQGEIEGGTQLTTFFACGLCKRGVVITAQILTNYSVVETKLLEAAVNLALQQHLHHYHRNGGIPSREVVSL